MIAMTGGLRGPSHGSENSILWDEEVQHDSRRGLRLEHAVVMQPGRQEQASVEREGRGAVHNQPSNVEAKHRHLPELLSTAGGQSSENPQKSAREWPVTGVGTGSLCSLTFLSLGWDLPGRPRGGRWLVSHVGLSPLSE